jgi:hypothetical protein
MIRDIHPGSGSWFFPIPDPGSMDQKSTGFRIRICSTAKNADFYAISNVEVLKKYY